MISEEFISKKITSNNNALKLSALYRYFPSFELALIDFLLMNENYTLVKVGDFVEKDDEMYSRLTYTWINGSYGGFNIRIKVGVSACIIRRKL